MTIKQHKVKSCCGSVTYIFDMDKPIKKIQLQVFINQGYSAPKSYQTSGVFYVTIGGLTATTSYGSTRVNARCHGNNCQKLLDDFMVTLETAINTN